MRNLQNEYIELFNELSAINSIRRLEAEKETQFQNRVAEALRAVRESYSAKLKKLDDDIAQTQDFLDTAKNYTRAYSQVGPIAPPNFSYMRGLDMNIDDTSVSDANATELAQVCNGALQFLKHQRQQVESSEKKDYIARKKQAEDEREVEKKDIIRELDRRYAKLLHDGRLEAFAQEIKRQSDTFFIDPNKIYDLPVPKKDADILKFGVIFRPFPIADQYCNYLHSVFGYFFDQATKTIRIPFGIGMQTSIKMRLIYPENTQDKIEKIVGGFLFNILRNRAPLTNRVLYIDAVTRNPNKVGALEQLTGESTYISFPQNPKDDIVELKRLANPKATDQRYLFLRGYPDYYSTEARDLIRNIATNYQSYKVTVVSFEAPMKYDHRDQKDIIAFIDACFVENNGNNTVFHYPGKSEGFEFGWFTAPRALSAGMIQHFSAAYKPIQKKNDFFVNFPLPQTISYQRGNGRKGICVPLGFETRKNEVFSCVFDDTNPFGFLMGAAGSGKSSLLHIILTGIVSQYHPDDVELWMADFNRVGFMRYKTHCPPHLRYLLLDSSPLYCFSFIDKLVEEYEKRQKVFAKNQWDNIIDIPATVYMPIIFVVLDEFDLMSEAIKDSDAYREKLQMIISKGRKFGFRILFSTQKYTTGSSGLTQTARINLNVRMAMYAPDQDEIKQTIGVPNLKDEEKQAIQDIKPYQVLYKQADKIHGYQFDHVENFFLDTKGLDQRDAWIDKLNMVKRKEFDPSKIEQYKDKKPVIIDGITDECFIDKTGLFAKCTQDYFSSFSAQPTDKLLFLGSPCAFDKAIPAILVEDEYQNILLFCSYAGSNARYLSEVMAAAIRSAGLSKLQTEIWAPPKDVCLNSTVVSNYWMSSDSYSDVASISKRIHHLRQMVDAEQNDRRLIAVFNLPKIIRQIVRFQGNIKTSSSGYQLPQRSSSLGVDLKNPFGSKTNPIDFAVQYAQENKTKTNDGADTYDVLADFYHLLQWGPASGVHFLISADSFASLKASGCIESSFPHVVAFRMNDADASAILDSYSRQAKRLPEGVFLYTNRRSINMFVPYSNADLNNSKE